MKNFKTKNIFQEFTYSFKKEELLGFYQPEHYGWSAYKTTRLKNYLHSSHMRKHRNVNRFRGALETKVVPHLRRRKKIAEIERRVSRLGLRSLSQLVAAKWSQGLIRPSRCVFLPSPSPVPDLRSWILCNMKWGLLWIFSPFVLLDSRALGTLGMGLSSLVVFRAFRCSQLEYLFQNFDFLPKCFWLKGGTSVVFFRLLCCQNMEFSPNLEFGIQFCSSRDFQGVFLWIFLR